MGPGASVLLPEALDRHHRALIDNVLASTGERHARAIDVTTLQPLGYPYTSAHGRSFGIHDGEPDLEAEDLALIEATFSFHPRAALSFDAPTNQPEDHFILGVLVLYMAEMFNGIINFNGALVPPLPEPLNDPAWYWEAATWSDIEPYVAAMAAELPGTLLAMPYKTVSNRIWATHVGDVPFMRAWLHHPLFHMIK